MLRRTFNGTNEVLSTYYVYDDRGNLAFVLPPEINPDRDSGVPTSTELNLLAYQYRYDKLGRMAYRRLPSGGTWENYVYNPAGSLIFHQDSRQQSETVPGFTPGQYHTFYKYDSHGRVILRGVERARSWSREQIQNHVNTQPPYWEERSTASGHFHGYTNLAQPQGTHPNDRDVLEANYYDDYTGIPGVPHNQSASYSGLTQGLLVASKVKVQGTASTYLWTVYYYDNKGQLVRQYKQHYQGGGASSNKFDDITNEYSFAGQLVKSTRKHHTTSATTPTLTVITEYTYDHMGRQRDTYKTVNLPSPAPAGIRTLIARNTYNDVGQKQTTSLHSTNSGGAFAVQNSMSYNARGWLTGSSSPQFAMELQYDNGVVPQYNGNIAGQKWGIPGNLDKTYTYRYDALNRLTEGTMANNRAREAVAYNKQGNITSLTRTIGTGSTVVDQLTYSYNGNRLTSVADANSHNATPNPYHLTGTTSYLYGANGNVTRRRNVSAGTNNIDTIIYNYLDLPQQINAPSGNVTLVYDGAGRKLRRQFAGVNTDYIDGIQYDGASVSSIQTEVGRAVRNGNTYRYEYTLADHLGNARYSFDYYNNAVRKLQSDDYYPFGLAFNSTVPGGQKNDYLYNGKELQNGIRQYDYGARLYDPVIGRWGVIDPLQEVYYPISPYTYAANNPLMFVDVNGEYVGTVTGLVSGAIMGAVMAAIDGQNIYAGMLKGAAVGGLAGAAIDISVATLGAAPAAVVAAGAISGAVGSVAGQLTETGRVSAGQVAVSAVAGGALGYAGSKLAPVAGRLVGAAEQAIEKSAARAVGSLANSAVRSIGSYADDVGRGGISLADKVANNAATAGVNTKTALAPYWPSNGGGLGSWTKTIAQKGEVFDRYGNINGTYASPVGTPYSMRSLSPNTSMDDYFKFEVLKPFPIRQSTIAPAFGQMGFGQQIQTPIGVNYLRDFGYIKFL